MTAPLSATTELEAINEMLEVIGEAPINTLTVTGRADVSIAKSILDRQTRRFCTRGWFWNTDEKVTLAVDGSGKIPVPTNALQVDPYDLSKNLAVRGGYLWDRDNNTDSFTESVVVTIVRALDFEDLIQPARDYVVMVSARVFAKRMLGDVETVDFTSEDLTAALIEVEKAEDDAADHSLRQDATTMNIIARYRSPAGIY